MSKVLTQTGLVSIIVPIYKVESYLQQCLDSISSQTYRNFEAILVDDGSPDQCGVICDAYAEKDSRFCVIHQKNAGVSAARNIGIDQCHGEYIMFVDGDDYISTTMCKRLVTALEMSQADIAICGFWVMGLGQKRSVGMARKHVISGKEAVIQYFAGSGANDLSTVWNKLYRRSIFNRKPALRFPVKELYEDEFLSYKLLYRAEKIVQVSEPLYYYRQRINSAMHTISWKQMESRMRCIMEYYRWAEECAPEMRNLIEYAAVRIFNGFVWSFVKNPEFENFKPIVARMNQEILMRTHHLHKNPYINLRTYKNYLLMKMGIIIPWKKGELFLKKKRGKRIL